MATRLPPTLGPAEADLAGTVIAVVLLPMLCWAWVHALGARAERNVSSGLLVTSGVMTMAVAWLGSLAALLTGLVQGM